MSYSVNQGVAISNGIIPNGHNPPHPNWVITGNNVQQVQQQHHGAGLGILNQGIGYSGHLNPTQNNGANLFQAMTRQLLHEQPSERSVYDTIYPYDLNITTSNMMFHLLVWRDSDEDRKKNFWKMVEMPVMLTANTTGAIQEGNLIFTSRQYRRDFIKWWTSYANRFYNGILPIDAFLPRIRPGKISGVFVEHSTHLDHLPYNYMVYPDMHVNLARGLIDALPAWAWIVGNCVKPVFHHSGGWFFSSLSEATKFTLFDPTKNVT